MNVRKLYLVSLLGLVLFMALVASCAPPAEAGEPTQQVKHRGYIDHAALVATTKPTRSGTTTKGWVGNKSFKLKTTTRGNRTTTKGYIDGKYVKIKTRKNDR